MTYKIDLVPYPTRAEGWVNRSNHNWYHCYSHISQLFLVPWQGPTEEGRISREDKKRGPRRNLILPKKHLFHSKPEVLRTTFRPYKIPKSNFRAVSLTLTAPHRHSSSFDILSSSVCQESKPRMFVIYCLHKRVSIKTICFCC